MMMTMTEIEEIIIIASKSNLLRSIEVFFKKKLSGPYFGIDILGLYKKSTKSNSVYSNWQIRVIIVLK